MAPSTNNSARMSRIKSKINARYEERKTLFIGRLKPLRYHVHNVIRRIFLLRRLPTSILNCPEDNMDL